MFRINTKSYNTFTNGFYFNQNLYLAEGSVSFSSGFSGVGSQGLLLMGRIGAKVRGLPSFYLKRPKNFIKHLRYVFFHRYLLGGTRVLYSACC